MNFDANSVPGGMGEVSRQLSTPEDASRCFIYIATTDACADCRNGAFLRFQHGFVRRLFVFLNAPDVDSTRHVGAVPVEGPTEVADDGLAALHHPGPRLMMRAGRVGPAPDDGEVDPLVALDPQTTGDVA